MIAAMTPVLKDGTYVFCSTADPEAAALCAEAAIGMFVEAEGDSFILPVRDAERFGFDCALPMRMITLTVRSALDGVGLISAVASELTAVGIPSNVVAAFHHDHLFVPEKLATRALRALEDLQVTRKTK